MSNCFFSRHKKGSLTPVRSSPRLSKNTTANQETPVSSSKVLTYNEDPCSSSKETKVDDSVENESVLSPKKGVTDVNDQLASNSSPYSLPKLRARKSLCRKVLETNALNRVLNSPQDSPKSRKSRIVEEHQEITKTEVSVETVHVESTFKYADGEEIHQLSSTKKHNLTTSFIESDLDTSEDFSINYDVAEEPKLSHYTHNTTNNSVLQNEESQIAKDIKNNDSNVSKVNNVMVQNETPKGKSFIGDETLDTSVSTSQYTLSDISEYSFGISNQVFKPKLRESLIPRDPPKEIEDNKNNETSHDSNVSKLNNVPVSVMVGNKSSETPKAKSFIDDEALDRNVFNQSSVYTLSDCSDYSFGSAYKVCGPKRESMTSCSNNREKSVDNTQNDDDDDDNDEAMDVDANEDLIEEGDKEFKNEGEVLIERNLEEIQQEEECKESLLESKQNKEKLLEDESSNRPVDPEMNVFEISDDLSVNNGSVLEKEVTFEEGDLYYDQQNSLERVLDENIVPVSSTPLSESEEESDVNEEENFEKVQQEEEYEVLENSEIIEIGSSSDENEEKNDEDCREYENERSNQDSESDNQVEKLEVCYERNIYDSEDDSSSESSYERHYSEISENSDDLKYEKSDIGSLFHGDIILTGEQEENDRDEESEEDENIEEQDESEESTDIDNQQEKIKTTTIKEQETNENDDCMEDSSEIDRKLFDEDQLITRIDERIEEQLENVSASNRNFNETEVECGLFHGEILFRSTEESTVIAEDQLITIIDEKNETHMLSGNAHKNKVEDAEQEVTEEVSSRSSETTSAKQPLMMIAEIVEEKSEDKLEQTLENVKSANEDNTVARNQNLNVECAEVDVQSDKNDKQQEEPVYDGRKDGIVETEEKTCDTGETENKSRKEEITVCEQDPLDATFKSPSPNPNITEIDLNIEKNEGDSSVITTKIRTRSGSVSSSASTKDTKRSRRKLSEDREQPSTSKGFSKRNVGDDIAEKLEDTSETTDSPPRRILRSRRVSADENVKSTSTLRKRSASVDEIKIVPDRKASKKEKVVNDSVKTRNQRAESVSQLPKIIEEEDSAKGVKPKRAKSVVENYTMNRRTTRRQVAVLTTIQDGNEEKNINLESMDPIVFLDRLPFDGKPDLEEKKVYENSPSSSNSSPSTPKRASRRLRSASQASESSYRSKSKTPVRSVKGRSRKNSTNEEGSSQGTSKKQFKEILESTKQDVDTPESTITTRSRARSASVSSVNSEDSNVSETVKTGKARTRLTSKNTLPEIKEEPNKSEVPVPKKRSRKNSSHK